MNWGSEDFIAALLLIGGAALALFVLIRLCRTRRRRIAAIISIAGLTVLLWIELAVGIFD